MVKENVLKEFPKGFVARNYAVAAADPNNPNGESAIRLYGSEVGKADRSILVSVEGVVNAYQEDPDNKVLSGAVRFAHKCGLIPTQP